MRPYSQYGLILIKHIFNCSLLHGVVQLCYASLQMAHTMHSNTDDPRKNVSVIETTCMINNHVRDGYGYSFGYSVPFITSCIGKTMYSFSVCEQLSWYPVPGYSTFPGFLCGSKLCALHASMYLIRALKVI